MSTIKIKDMNANQLHEYIISTKRLIVNLVGEYTNINGQKLIDNGQIEDMVQKAYNIKEFFEHVSWTNNKIKINNDVQLSKNIKPKRGEIWTCQLGKNIGSEENKIRPVIIIQNNTGNERSPTTIIVPISNRPKKIATHIILRRSDYISVDSEKNEITGTILCEQIKVVSKARSKKTYCYTKR